MVNMVLWMIQFKFKENLIIGRNIITASSQCLIKQDNSWTVVNQGAKLKKKLKLERDNDKIMSIGSIILIRRCSRSNLTLS